MCVRVQNEVRKINQERKDEKNQRPKILSHPKMPVLVPLSAPACQVGLSLPAFLIARSFVLLFCKMSSLPVLAMPRCLHGEASCLQEVLFSCHWELEFQEAHHEQSMLFTLFCVLPPLLSSLSCHHSLFSLHHQTKLLPLLVLKHVACLPVCLCSAHTTEVPPKCKGTRSE